MSNKILNVFNLSKIIDLFYSVNLSLLLLKNFSGLSVIIYHLIIFE